MDVYVVRYEYDSPCFDVFCFYNELVNYSIFIVFDNKYYLN